VTRFPGIIIALVVGIAASAAQIGEVAADDCRPKRQTELAVAFLRNIPVVNVMVNGTPATFLLDTGAERTIMAAAAALRLGVESHYEYPRRMRSLGSAVVSGDARLRSLGLGGGIALADFRVLVGSLSLPGPAGKPLDGLLGADFFSSFEVDLDLAHNRLTLYERLSCAIAAPPWSQPYTTMPVNRSLHDHLFFPVGLDGHKLAAFIDTGAEVSTIDAAAAMALGVTGAALNHDPVANLRGAGSEVINSRVHRFARMEIGGETLRDRIIAVTNLRLQDADLVLGIDFLRLRRVWFSYGSHQIFLGRPA
jgi:predicted aspartyl protease